MFFDHAAAAAYAVALHRHCGIDRAQDAPSIHTTEVGETCFPGLLVTGQTDLPADARAYVVRTNRHWTVFYDRNLCDADRRFHIAHEFGHIVLSEEARAFPSRREIQPSGRDLERWCDYFAAELLVPLPMLARLVGERPLFPEGAAEGQAWDDFVDQLHGGRCFNVPRGVMVKRLRALAAQQEVRELPSDARKERAARVRQTFDAVKAALAPKLGAKGKAAPVRSARVVVRG